MIQTPTYQRHTTDIRCPTYSHKWIHTLALMTTMQTVSFHMNSLSAEPPDLCLYRNTLYFGFLLEDAPCCNHTVCQIRRPCVKSF